MAGVELRNLVRNMERVPVVLLVMEISRVKGKAAGRQGKGLSLRRRRPKA